MHFSKEHWLSLAPWAALWVLWVGMSCLIRRLIIPRIRQAAATALQSRGNSRFPGRGPAGPS